MRRIILFGLTTIFVLFLVETTAGVLDFALIKLASLFDTKWQQAQIDFEPFLMELTFSILLGIPYILSLIIFELIIKKRTSIITRAIFTGTLVSLFYLLVINTLTMGRPSILDVYVLITLIVFFAGGFSLPYVDEFFMKKFGLKEAE